MITELLDVEKENNIMQNSQLLSYHHFPSSPKIFIQHIILGEFRTGDVFVSVYNICDSTYTKRIRFWNWVELPPRSFLVYMLSFSSTSSRSIVAYKSFLFVRATSFKSLVLLSSCSIPLHNLLTCATCYISTLSYHSFIKVFILKQ